MVKNLAANAGDIRDAGLIPGSERSSLEEGMSTHSRRIPWRKEGHSSQDSKELNTTEATEHACTHIRAYLI